jgi:hypothetical protein
MTMQTRRRAAWVVCALAVALHSVTALIMSANPFSTFTLGLFLFSCAPYLAMFVLSTTLKQPVPAAAGALAALIADALMFWSAFIDSKGSTAVLGLVFMPVWNLLVIAPAVAAVAFVFTRGPKRDSFLT